MRDATTARRRERSGRAFTAFLGGVGARVAHLRRRAGLSQQAAAEAAGLHLTGWQKLEAGDTNATLLTLFSVARALGVEVHQLVRPKSGDAAARRPGRPRSRPT